MRGDQQAAPELKIAPYASRIAEGTHQELSLANALAATLTIVVVQQAQQSSHWSSRSLAHQKERSVVVDGQLSPTLQTAIAPETEWLLDRSFRDQSS
jgi:hypothetical protein